MRDTATDEYMRAGMFLKCTFDFCSILLSFHNKIVGVEIFHGPEKFDETSLVYIGPVHGLACHIEIPPKFALNDRIAF